MILVTGSNGQLGSEFKHLLSPQQAVFMDFNLCDITDKGQLHKVVSENSIKAIINCAAYTAVDLAETEIEKATLVNEKGTENLALIAKAGNIKLIHISTDYVFSGNRAMPLTETDPTEPETVYGKTKLAGENAILKIHPTAAIIRTSWLYSVFSKNFVKTIVKICEERDSLNVIYDQIGTPTNSADLANAVLQIIPQIKEGTCEVYHYSNEGAISWYDFAKAICELHSAPKVNTCKINPINTWEYPTKARRPQYSVLNKGKIKNSFGLAIPYWKDSLKKAMTKILSEENTSELLLPKPGNLAKLRE